VDLCHGHPRTHHGSSVPLPGNRYAARCLGWAQRPSDVFPSAHSGSCPDHSHLGLPRAISIGLSYRGCRFNNRDHDLQHSDWNPDHRLRNSQPTKRTTRGGRLHGVHPLAKTPQSSATHGQANHYFGCQPNDLGRTIIRGNCRSDWSTRSG